MNINNLSNQTTKKKVVIVGAGTAGLVIANILQDYFEVKVIEKSKYNSYPIIYKIPMFIGILFRKSKKYILKKDIYTSKKRKIPFYESQLFGGASVINGCVHTLGVREIWCDLLKKFNFTLKELNESYFRNYTKKYEFGKINLKLAKITEIDSALYKTLDSIQISQNDIESSNQVGYGQIYNTVNYFFRSSVLSLLKKKNFLVYLNEFANELYFNKKGKLIGIKSNKRFIQADYVVMSSGTIGTNIFLLDQIKNKNIKLEQMNTVGKNIKDHVNLRVNIISHKKIGSFNEIEKSISSKLKILFLHAFQKPNLLTGTGATSGIHLDLDEDGKVDTRIQLVQFTESGRHGSNGSYFGEEPGFSFSITPIFPYSKGIIESNNGIPIIRPGYLTDKRDIELLIKALNFCINLTKLQPLSEYVKEIIDINLMISDPVKYMEDNLYSGHHLIGGTGAIINSNFQVNGINNLYICDASIFQEYAASNIHSSVVLLADLFSRRFININRTAQS